MVFERASDDLDECDVVTFHVAGMGAFALLHYRSYPNAEVALLVEQQCAAPPGFIPIIEFIGRTYGVPVSSFHWLEAGETARLAEATAGSYGKSPMERS